MDSYKSKYILYKYEPSLPNYFDQVDIIELDVEPSETVDMDYVIELACHKNHCTEREIKVIDVFETREALERYLINNDLRYLV